MNRRLKKFTCALLCALMIMPLLCACAQSPLPESTTAPASAAASTPTPAPTEETAGSTAETAASP